MSTNFGSYPLADSCEGLWLDMLLLGTLATELSFPELGTLITELSLPELGADRDSPFRADELDCETASLWV